MKGKQQIVFIPENLTALKNGGRISPTVALIGNTLGIKPVIVLQDGALEKSDMTRKEKKTFMEKITAFSKTHPSSDFDYTFVSFDANEHTYGYVLDFAKNALPNCDIIEGLVPINVCAHCGPGTLGLLVTPKINGKSLNEFVK